MPSYLDLGLIVIVLTSALLSMVRGFTREVLAIVSWAAAAVAALYLHPLVQPYLKPYIQKESLAMWVAIAIVFLVVLVVVTIITVKISDVILDSRVGALDRSLGFVFGAARGYLLAVVAFMFFVWLVPEKSQPEWVKNSKTKTYLEASREQLFALLPANPLAALKSLRGEKGTPTPEETPNDTGGEPATPPPVPATPPAKI